MNYFKVELPKEKSSIIKVMGVGGGGSNAVNYMYNKGITGVDFYLCNTDAQHLEKSDIKNKIQLGSNLTEGLGAGGEPEFGKKCALETIDKIEAELKNNTKMLFLTAGMGGGTGTGATPVIAQKAKQMGILTIGIVTRPFQNEGPHKAQRAEDGINELKPHVDAMLVISNDKILQMFSNLRYKEALSKADDILFTATRGIAEIITVEGYKNMDFMDVKAALQNSGKAIMGTGISIGDDRAMMAAQMALESPLLDENSIEGAKHILINICYGNEEPFTSEIDTVMAYFQKQAGDKANLKFALTQSDNLDKEISITVVATGFEGNRTYNSQLIEEEKDATLIHNQSNDEENDEALVITFDNIDEQLDHIIQNKEKESLNEPEFDYKPFDLNTNNNLLANHQNIKNNDMNVPAYKRNNVIFDEMPEDISKLYLEEDNTKVKFKDNGNKYLHGNVD